MRQALAMALQDYEGAVVMVSHDRHLLRTVTDRFYLVAGGRVQPFDGDLEDYARWLADPASVTGGNTGNGGAAGSVEAGSAAASADTRETASQLAVDRKARRQEEAQRRSRLSPLKSEVTRWERRIDELSAQRTQIESALADPALYAEASKSRLKDLLAQQTTVLRAVSEAEEEWLEATQRFEDAQTAESA